MTLRACLKLQDVNICKGDTRSDFLSLVKERGCTLRNSKGCIAATLDQGTVRNQDCEYLCNVGAVQCKICNKYS